MAIEKGVTIVTRSRSDKEYKPRDVYFTPPWVFDSLGMTFDLDVCAPREGVPWIPAINWFHEENDGLSQPWIGNIWMNPPYSKPKPWIDRFIEHGSGIGLIAMSRSNSFYRLWNDERIAFAVPQKALMFIDTEGKKRGIFMPVCFIAMGNFCIDRLRTANIGQVR